MGKGEIARNEQFLLFPQCFLLNQIIVSSFVHIFDIIFSFAAELEEPKSGISGKELNEVLLKPREISVQFIVKYCFQLHKKIMF